MIQFDIDSNQKHATISGEMFSQIREAFSVENPGAKFMKKFARFIPSRLYAITPTGRFDIGLYSEIRKYLTSIQYSGKIEIHNENQFTKLVEPGINWTAHQKYSTKFFPLQKILRDYQEEIVSVCIEKGRGTTVLATAGGKTLIIASLLSRLATFYTTQFKCLIIVPDLGLVDQTYNDFKQYGVPLSLSKWTGTQPVDLSCNVIIANIGILQSECSNLNWVEFIDVLVVDECHKIRRGNKINKILKDIKTPHRFGFTGTMPEDKLDQWNIVGKIGSVVYEKNSFDLRQSKYISQAAVEMIQVVYDELPPKVIKKSATDEYRAEIDFISVHSGRNNIVKKIVNWSAKNCLILVDFIKHGETLFNELSTLSPNKQVFFIRGEVEVEDREKVKQLMEKNSNIIVVAISKIFSTGINIENLHYIIFAAGGKAKIKIVQSIGRGLRLHKEKDKLIIFDIADQLKYGIQHAEKRKKLYEKERIPYRVSISRATK